MRSVLVTKPICVRTGISFARPDRDATRRGQDSKDTKDEYSERARA